MKNWKELEWSQLLPRIVADLLMVHLAAMASLAAVVLLQTDMSSPRAAEMIPLFQQYYLQAFCPLSLLFPIVFFGRGFYTRSRTYSLPYKGWALLQGTSLATLIFVFANFLATRGEDLPRTSVILFVVLVNTMTVGSRWLKWWLTPRPIRAEGRQASAPPLSMPRPVLVVGGAGYIGSILCRKLIDRGYTVRLLDSLVYGDEAIRDLIGHPRFELSIGDCRNIQNVVSAVNGAGAIIHLAAIVGDPACEQDRKAALEINFAATRMMIEVAKGYGVERFIFASSCSVYGETDEYVDENSAVGPISLYAQTKVDSEQALLKVANERFHPTILRLATVFGNSYRPRFDLVVNLLTAKALRDGVITIFNGEQWRPFIHVSDVAEGVVKVFEAPLDVVSGQIFNLGDSRLNYTLTQVAETIRKLVPGTRVDHVENPDRRNYRVCFDKVRRELGFHCGVTLEEGIRDLKEAIESHRIRDYTDPLYHNQRFLKAAGRLIPKHEIDTQVMAAFALAIENHNQPERLARR